MKAIKQYHGVPLDGRPMTIQLAVSDVAALTRPVASTDVKRRVGSGASAPFKRGGAYPNILPGTVNNAHIRSFFFTSNTSFIQNHFRSFLDLCTSTKIFKCIFISITMNFKDKDFIYYLLLFSLLPQMVFVTLIKFFPVEILHSLD